MEQQITGGTLSGLTPANQVLASVERSIGGKAPGGGPILSVGISTLSSAGSRHLGSSIGSSALNASASPAGREMTPSKVP